MSGASHPFEDRPLMLENDLAERFDTGGDEDDYDTEMEDRYPGDGDEDETPEPPPYPFCRTPKECAGKGYCPRDPACND